MHSDRLLLESGTSISFKNALLNILFYEEEEAREKINLSRTSTKLECI